MADTVFTAKDLTKTYTSGEAQVLALQGIDLERLSPPMTMKLLAGGFTQRT